MTIKFFELRDAATFIPVFAFKTSRHGNDRERWLLRRSGFGPESRLVILGRLECSGIDRNCTYDPYVWGGRTFPVAHEYIERHFDKLQSGAVIDVEWILVERKSAKISEKYDEV